MHLVLPFEYVIQSRSTATLLHSISKIHKQSFINLYQLIFLSFLNVKFKNKMLPFKGDLTIDL